MGTGGGTLGTNPARKHSEKLIRPISCSLVWFVNWRVASEKPSRFTLHNRYENKRTIRQGLNDTASKAEP